MIKQNVDWKTVFTALGFERAAKSTPDDWWAKSPFKTEETPSFHIDDTGCYYCFATGQGGDMLDLVQKVKGFKNVWEAAEWMNELSGTVQPSPAEDLAQKTVAKRHLATAPKKKTKGPNKPIRQTLLPLLTELGTHDQFASRGISAETCEKLGCGYLDPASLTKSNTNLAGRIVFQIRGVDRDQPDKATILSHIGRATTQAQIEESGKWTFYKGFQKSLELYQQDNMLLSETAQQQTCDVGHTIIVEGCFDAAKLMEAGIENVVATFGAKLSAEQTTDRLAWIAEITGVDRFLVWYDRDEAGAKGQKAALKTLLENDLEGEGFRWDRKFASASRDEIRLPKELGDVCQFSVDHLKWLRGQGLV